MRGGDDGRGAREVVVGVAREEDEGAAREAGEEGGGVVGAGLWWCGGLESRLWTGGAGGAGSRGAEGEAGGTA